MGRPTYARKPALKSDLNGNLSRSMKKEVRDVKTEVCPSSRLALEGNQTAILRKRDHLRARDVRPRSRNAKREIHRVCQETTTRQVLVSIKVYIALSQCN